MLAVTQVCCAGKWIKRANVVKKGEKRKEKKEFQPTFPLPSFPFGSFSFSSHLFGILKLITYSCSQKPINDDHLAQVNESWYLMKHQIKQH